jgi:citrate lyase beta subunit
MIADLGGHPPGADALVQHARIAVVVASAAQGMAAPVGGVHVAIDDLDSLQTSGSLLRQLGFGGRALIHPTHCEITNDAFTPTDAEIAWAHQVLARAEASAGGALRAADGSMVDQAVLRRARGIVDLTLLVRRG